MKLSVPREILKFENRVAVTPDSVKNLTKLGFDVFIEKNAGVNASFSDSDYTKVGAKVSPNLIKLSD